MATDSFGVTSTGFKPMAFSDVTADLESALKSAFGDNINLDDRSVFGQFVGIMSERLTLLWQLGQAVYNANNPVAATGVSLDNIAALNGLSRQAAHATTTAPQPVQQANGVTLYGLVLYGTPGTVVPQGSLVSNGLAAPTTFSLDANVTIGAGSNARQSLVFSNQPTSGTYTLTLSDASGNTLTTPSLTCGLPAQDPILTVGSGAQASYTLTLAQTAAGALTSKPIQPGASAAQIQTILQTLTGYNTVSVTAAAAGSFALHFPSGPTPMIQVTGPNAVSLVNSIEAAVNTLTLSSGAQPFTDVAVTATNSGLQFDFGAGTAAAGQVGTGNSTIPLVSIGSSSLNASGAVTNLTVLESRVGAPAQGVGSATSTTSGPSQVLANALQTIVTPKAGWSAVNNQLDCVSGADTETDSALLARIQAVRAAQGSTSLASVVERVASVAGVTASLGFQNLTNAAQQLVTIEGSPTQGTFQLSTATGTTGALAFNAAALDVQTALASLPGYASLKVSGTATYGFTVDFNGSTGGQAQPLLVVLNNSTGTTVDVAFGRPPHSVEIVVAGGADTDVANAIFAALPAGMGTYGAPVVNTTGTVAAGSNQITLAQALGVQPGLCVNMPGVPIGATVLSNSGNVITLSASALTTQNNAPCLLNHALYLADSAGNSQLLAFSRPTPILIFVQIELVTDQYSTPGLPASGINPASKWSPASVATIQSNILEIGNAVAIGGTVVAQGSQGLVGCFNAVPGIVSYSLTFGTQANPTNAANLSLQPSQSPVFEAANVAVSYT